MESNQDLVDLFVSNMSAFLSFFGINESIAKIWATILLSDEPLTQKEISEKTGFSLSLVSPALKTLERMSLIEKVGRSGKNKKYIASKTLSEAFIMMLINYKNNQIAELEEKLKALSEKNIDENIKSEIDKVKTEAKSILNLINKIAKQQNKS